MNAPNLLLAAFATLAGPRVGGAAPPTKSRKGGDVQFELHPSSNFGSHTCGTLLDSDCILQGR